MSSLLTIVCLFLDVLLTSPDRSEGRAVAWAFSPIANQYVQMYLLAMARPSLREKIIESGVQTLHERGFAGAGVREITADAGVPQGCFTNHFRSKESFAAVILDRYHERTQSIMDRTLRDEGRPAVERLRAYFDAITEWLQAAGWRYGCLVGNLSLEVPEHSELLRTHLVEVCRSLTASFADTVRAGQAAGEIRDDLDAEDVAAFLLASWEGAMMRMKVDRSPRPIEQFKRVLFASVLVASPAAVCPNSNQAR